MKMAQDKEKPGKVVQLHSLSDRTSPERDSPTMGEIMQQFHDLNVLKAAGEILDAAMAIQEAFSHQLPDDKAYDVLIEHAETIEFFSNNLKNSIKSARDTAEHHRLSKEDTSALKM